MSVNGFLPASEVFADSTSSDSDSDFEPPNQEEKISETLAERSRKRYCKDCMYHMFNKNHMAIQRLEFAVGCHQRDLNQIRSVLSDFVEYYSEFMSKVEDQMDLGEI